MVKSVTVRAPCSTANLGPGFDVFGLALDAFYDEVTVTKKPKSFGIKIVSSDDIPLDPKKNTSGIAAKAMKKEFGRYIEDGIEISIKKGVPAGYGLGSSAASAAACVQAIRVLFELDAVPQFKGEVPDNRLIYCAGQGEKASAGTVHYDNVSAAFLGGFTLAWDRSDDLTLHKLVRNSSIALNVKKASDLGVHVRHLGLKVVLAIPKIKVPKMKTKVSRGVLPKTVKFTDAMKDLKNVSEIAFCLGKLDWVPTSAVNAESISERARKKMIPGYDKVKKLGKAAGANAVTISGAGPTVVAFVQEKGNVAHLAKDVGEAMKKGFKSAKVDCDIVICKPSNGPEIIKVVK